MPGGIYAIRNKVNGHQYVGSAVDFERRWREHLSRLRKGTHCNRYLQRAFRKYGEATFEFVVLERVKYPEMLIQREQHYLDILHPEYNLSPTAGSQLGVIHTEEARQNMSKAQMGKHLSEETRKKIGEAHIGKCVSEETRRKLSEMQKGEKNFWFGKHHSEETRRKISQATKGERNPMFGKSHSEEARKKIGKAGIGNQYALGSHHPHSAEHRRKIGEAQKGRVFSEETRQKMSVAAKQVWARRRGGLI